MLLNKFIWILLGYINKQLKRLFFYYTLQIKTELIQLPQ